MTTRRQMLAMSASAVVGSAVSVSAQGNEVSSESRGKITQVRNATLRIDYGGVRFLVDPMLADRHALPGFPGTVNSEQRNPMVHLPMPIADIVDVDAVIVTHLHEDHWDQAARDALPRDLPVFARNGTDAQVIRGQGFTDVRVLSESSEFGGVRLIKTAGRHGTEAHYELMAEILGEVCGLVFSHPDEKTIYLAGDTIWNDDVAAVLSAHAPEVAILNSGYAMVQGVDGGIIMGTEDVLRVHRAAPETVLIASHMEAINHCVLTRAELWAFAADEGLSDKLRTPGDGETSML
ncbi:L-ascorbate metabolism protein UlaG, beta-lactamase superfamily [Palleronia marisminoris]|uniref:Metal-dependent hydrolase n=1 Tax=Palleronia marisminoris TaxID=315423 RepID=A0A1Y5TK18_9RHOB|nr:MBL fold metallo-hydrolase [Palleronia marisminoris]SFH36750.1 L-ascorbate metabolism protein UlaG, beta-lactamase superfamily [Palleronia marisminoris]SLN62247.1 metal-dependent hydrolase [Palleronia marisminoris]